MGFRKRPHGLGRLAIFLCTASTALSVYMFVQYKLGVRDVQRLMSRPQGAAGPTLIHGVARGTPGYISSGNQALLAAVEMWDRSPSKKNATPLCWWLEGGQFEVDGHTVAITTEGRKFNRLGRWPRGQPGSLLVGLPDIEDITPTAEMLRRCPRAAVARVIRLRPTDPVTLLGCMNGGAVVPCEDGTDMLLGYPLDEAKKKLLSDELLKLLFAALTGFPPLVYLIIALSRSAPSLARRARANQEIS